MHISKIKPGDVLIPDRAFDCVKPGDPVTVKENGLGLFFDCCCGSHYLDGQLSDTGDLVGLYTPVEIKTRQTGAST